MTKEEVMEVVEEVGPIEDVVQALLECLVEPLLGCKSREAPTLSQQTSMAKQVHAVVLLYNYYYRKQHQDHELEFLTFSSFCQMAIILKPSLLSYMKLMHQSDYSKVDNLESQLSVTEKAIMSACNISSALEASKVVPFSEKWPTSKVAVFLVDSGKENCLLLHRSMTCGVSSIVEKYLDVSSGLPIESRDLQCADGGLEELALSATVEATGINKSDLVVLESHLVYSLDKEKAAARLYIVQFIKCINEDLIIPIEDIIESLQGPLIKKNSSGWTATPAVEYFHLLPYREVLSHWRSRQLLSNDLQDLNVDLVTGPANDGHVGGSSGEKELNEICQKNLMEPLNSSAHISTCYFPTKNMTEPLKSSAQTSTGCFPTKNLTEPLKSSAPTPTNCFPTKNMMEPLKSSAQTSTGCFPTKGNEVQPMIQPCNTESNDEKIDEVKRRRGIQNGGSVGPSQPGSQHSEEMVANLASMEQAVAQAALNILRWQREKLCHQRRSVEDEIAECDEAILKLLNGDENVPMEK